MNFMIPELVYRRPVFQRPYYADQSFATAGASNINYATTLEQHIVSLEGGGEGCSRCLFAVTRRR